MSLRRAILPALLVLASAVGCGDSGDPAPADGVSSDASLEIDVTDVVDESDSSQDGDIVQIAADAAVSDDVADTAASEPHPGPPTLAERGFTELRTIVHLHSAYSHDGCDDEGLSEDGTPNAACVRRMKDALCEEHIAVALMSDHPGHMEDFPFEDLLYADEAAGDIIIRDEAGAAVAASFACPEEGQGGVDGRSWLAVGFETRHTMPVGLRRHLSDPALYDVTLIDGHSEEDMMDLIADVRAAGGMMIIPHAEEEDTSAELIASLDVPAMEIYNFHANVEVIFGGAGADLFELEAFLSDEADAPDPDLIALMMLAEFPEPSLEKWRRVSAQRPITPVAGSDVHENVVLPPLCEGGLCEGLAEEFPNLVEILAAGGPIVLGDGGRIDGYGRIFRWVNNRTWVAGEPSPLDGVMAGLESGRNVVVFEILGDAVGTALMATPAGEDPSEASVTDIGGTIAASAGPVLWARSPDVPRPGRVASWSDGTAAVMSTTLWRSDAAGDEAVLTWEGPSTWQEVPVETPGSYHLEVWLEPLHLKGSLGPSAERAEESYRWVETGAIRVE